VSENTIRSARVASQPPARRVRADPTPRHDLTARNAFSTEEGSVMELVIGTIAIVAVLIALAAVRVSRIASWRSLAMVATSTGSLKACLDFVRYCDRL
jgi:Na+-transporting NADH:ubiquinone oxidoreductase subunit NqrB